MKIEKDGREIRTVNNSGQTYPMMSADGFTAGQLKPGEVKMLRAIFKAPKDLKMVGINLSGLGSFDDVKIGP